MISTKSNIDKTVIIGDGTMIISGTTINIGSKIGRHSIINTSCSIDHDNLIKNYVNCSPGVVSAGNVTINDKVFIGMGTSIKQNTIIDSNTTIGAQSYVNKNCKKNSTYYGIPIKKMKSFKYIPLAEPYFFGKEKNLLSIALNLDG